MKPGKFNCVVLAPVNGWFGESGQNSTPFLRIPLQVTDPGECQGETIDFVGWLSERAFEKTIARVSEVFDWDGDLELLANLLDTGPFVGKACSIVTEEEEYNGKKSVKIKWLNRAGPPPMEKSAAQSLAQRLNARSKAAASGQQPSQAPDAPSYPQSGSSSGNSAFPTRPPADPDLDAAPDADDIPF